MGEKMSTCYYKNEGSLRIAETTDEQIIFIASVYHGICIKF